MQTTAPAERVGQTVRPGSPRRPSPSHRARPERPFALLPAFTFVATAVAVEQCGYQVFLADVDASTWTLDPVRLSRAVDLGSVGVVIPVAPFGRPVPQEPWSAFSAATGIPVVIDAAASFELGAGPEFLGRIPVAMSFHATKSFAVGEGGCVVATDEAVAERVLRALNFGFSGTRDSASASINGKLSEYHAAIGLAELDGWDAKHAELTRVATTYRERLSDAGLGDRLTAAPEIASCYVLFRAEDLAERRRVHEALAAASIDSRMWYGAGLQHETYYRRVRREATLDATEALAPTLLGLPVAPDLETTEIELVVRTIEGALRD
jgi:dTDP-4-amino-4,6-dideoxygalactose transaminase